LRSELTTYDDAVVRQLCSGVFEGKNDTKKEESHDDKSDGQNGRNSRLNDNSDGNDGTHADGIAQNGMTYHPLNIPSQHTLSTYITLFSS